MGSFGVAAATASKLWQPDRLDVLDAVQDVRAPLYVRHGPDGTSLFRAPQPDCDALPPLFPEWLGDPGFLATHGCRFPYVVGEMARGLATVEMVTAAQQAGLVGFFGAAGLAPAEIEGAILRIQAALGPDAAAWGSNLIHSVHDRAYEDAVIDVYLRTGVRRVSASAFMALSPAIVRFAATGLARAANGEVRRRNFVFAKISRPEVAAHFLSPPPAAMLAALVSSGALTPTEAQLAAEVAVAADITVEADSGGHTDNRPLAALFPAIATQRDRIAAQHHYKESIRLGAAGSLGTPGAVASAFALGAAYVLTGSVNQAAIESGLSDAGRAMLCEAGIADVAMAPAADMFELGVKVQVLRRGTFFAATISSSTAAGSMATATVLFGAGLPGAAAAGIAIAGTTTPWPTRPSPPWRARRRLPMHDPTHARSARRTGTACSLFVALAAASLWAVPAQGADVRAFAGSLAVDDSTLQAARGGMAIAGALNVDFGARVRVLWNGLQVAETTINSNPDGTFTRSTVLSGVPGVSLLDGALGPLVKDGVFNLPFLQGMQGVKLEDVRGTTFAVTAFEPGRMASALVNNAPERDVQQLVDVRVTLNNFPQLRSELLQAAATARLVEIAPDALRTSLRD